MEDMSTASTTVQDTLKMVQCVICEKVIDRTLLKKHMKIHRKEKPYKCKICKKNITEFSNFLIHLRIHTGEKPFECKECKMGFSSNKYLKRHEENIHQEEKRITCATCGKGFSCASHYRIHQRTHTGEKPYQCESCGMSFSHKFSLTIHIKRYHTDERNYVCDVCAKSFVHVMHLKNHARIHTGEKPYKCNVCGKSFTRSHHLQKHSRSHTGETPFVCELCGKAFRDNYHLKRHVLKLHDDEFDKQNGTNRVMDCIVPVSKVKSTMNEHVPLIDDRHILPTLKGDSKTTSSSLDTPLPVLSKASISNVEGHTIAEYDSMPFNSFISTNKTMGINNSPGVHYTEVDSEVGYDSSNHHKALHTSVLSQKHFEDSRVEIQPDINIETPLSCQSCGAQIDKPLAVNAALCTVCLSYSKATPCLVKQSDDCFTEKQDCTNELDISNKTKCDDIDQRDSINESDIADEKLETKAFADDISNHFVHTKNELQSPITSADQDTTSKVPHNDNLTSFDHTSQAQLKKRKRQIWKPIICPDTGKKRYPCEICQKTFGSTTTVKTHMRTHTGEKPYCCHICGQAFRHSITLTIHIRSHTGEKPFVCDICGKAYRDAHHLREHANTHLKDNPNKCDVCGACFTRWHHLTKHKRIHTGERPYKCDICGKGFIDNYHCKRHLKTHDR